MPIDIDVNDRTPKKPCATEGCGYPNYHACTYGKPNLFPMLLGLLGRRKKPNWYTGPKSEEARAAMSESQKLRWARVREENRERDESIVDRYAEGDIGMHGIAKEFDVSVKVVRNILHEAQTAGRIVIRKTGVNIRPRNYELEARVIQRYREGGIGMEPMAAELGVGKDVVRKILLQAQSEGLITIRPRGRTIAKSAA